MAKKAEKTKYRFVDNRLNLEFQIVDYFLHKTDCAKEKHPEKAVYIDYRNWTRNCLTVSKIKLETNYSLKYTVMLYWSIVFFVVAIIAALFGFRGIASVTSSIAKFLFFIFIVLFVLSLLYQGFA